MVKGASDGLKLSSAARSQHDALTAAGKNVMPDYMWRTWYKKMLADADNAMGALMIGEINSQGFVDRMQQAADATAQDISIKYTH